MIWYCTCYIEYLFRIDVTDSRDRTGESLSSALPPVSLQDAIMCLYTLVNNSDIRSALLRDGEKENKGRYQETAVITKELPSQGKNCFNFLSRSEWIHSLPTVCDSLKCFHSNRHKTCEKPSFSQEEFTVWAISDPLCSTWVRYWAPGLSKSFPSTNVITGQCTHCVPGHFQLI